MTRTDRTSAAGFTLIEITVVTAILLGLISTTWIGVSAYKNGSNRAICIQNAARTQTALRSYSNLHALRPGEHVESLRARIISPGSFIPTMPECPGGGIYLFHHDPMAPPGKETVPQIGQLYLECTIADHRPLTTAGW